MNCPKCNDSNFEFQTVGDVNSRGGVVPWWYKWTLFPMFIDLLLTLCFLRFPIRRFLKNRAKKTKTKMRTYAVCQSCGYRFEVKNSNCDKI